MRRSGTSATGSERRPSRRTPRTTSRVPSRCRRRRFSVLFNFRTRKREGEERGGDDYKIKVKGSLLVRSKQEEGRNRFLCFNYGCAKEEGVPRFFKFKLPLSLVK